MEDDKAEIARNASARLHVEAIRRNKFSIGSKRSNPLTQDLQNAVKNLSSELYTKDIHFLMELIQNAEDNEYAPGVTPSLEFVMTIEDICGVRMKLDFQRLILNFFVASVNLPRRVEDVRDSLRKKELVSRVCSLSLLNHMYLVTVYSCLNSSFLAGEREGTSIQRT